jgi:hypothetical protein
MRSSPTGLRPPPPQGEDRAGIHAIFATAFRTAVFCTHLVARKGRKASDRCGDGGDRAGIGGRNGSRSGVGSCPLRPSGAGSVRGVTIPPKRRLLRTGRAECQTSSKRYLFNLLRTSSGRSATLFHHHRSESARLQTLVRTPSVAPRQLPRRGASARRRSSPCGGGGPEGRRGSSTVLDEEGDLP